MVPYNHICPFFVLFIGVGMFEYFLEIWSYELQWQDILWILVGFIAAMRGLS